MSALRFMDSAGIAVLLGAAGQRSDRAPAQPDHGRPHG